MFKEVYDANGQFMGTYFNEYPDQHGAYNWRATRGRDGASATFKTRQEALAWIEQVPTERAAPA